MVVFPGRNTIEKTKLLPQVSKIFKIESKYIKHNFENKII